LRADFELVRAHHPDAHHAAGLSAELAHTRFRTIKAAYDFLAGRTLSPHPNARPAPAPQHFDPYMHELARRRRAYYAAHGRAQTHGESGEGTGYTRRRDPDDGFNEGGRKERLILAFGVLVSLFYLRSRCSGCCSAPCGFTADTLGLVR
jgi:hypothetical protein